MADVLTFFKAMPKLCGAKNADRWAFVIESTHYKEV